MMHLIPILKTDKAELMLTRTYDMIAASILLNIDPALRAFPTSDNTLPYLVILEIAVQNAFPLMLELFAALTVIALADIAFVVHQKSRAVSFPTGFLAAHHSSLETHKHILCFLIESSKNRRTLRQNCPTISHLTLDGHTPFIDLAADESIRTLSTEWSVGALHNRCQGSLIADHADLALYFDGADSRCLLGILRLNYSVADVHYALESS